MFVMDGLGEVRFALWCRHRDALRCLLVLHFLRSLPFRREVNFVTLVRTGRGVSVDSTGRKDRQIGCCRSGMWAATDPIARRRDAVAVLRREGRAWVHTVREGTVHAGFGLGLEDAER